MDGSDFIEGEEAPRPIFEFMYNYVDQDNFKKYFRLIMIVCVYLFMRTWYTNFAKQKEIQRKLEEDKLYKEEKAKREQEEKEQKIENVEQEAQSFGWGKTTRRNVKRQEQILEEKIKEVNEANQSAYDAAEDHDIDDLLE